MTTGHGGTVPQVLSRESAEALGRRVLGFVTAPEAHVSVSSRVAASTQFARGDTHVMSDDVELGVGLNVAFGDQAARLATTRLDDHSLRRFVAETEAAAKATASPFGREPALGPQVYPPPPKLFFDSVPSTMGADARAALVREVVEASEKTALIAAGSVNLSLEALAVMNTAGLFGYACKTYGEMSVTARAKDGRASGWAWGGFEDWSRVRPGAVVERAVDFARRSANPVAVEPGRYTVVLEPAAVAELIATITVWWQAQAADGGWSPFSKDPRGTNKIGLQMMDQRLGIISDPWDPELPRSVMRSSGEPLTKVVWFERGVLKNLEYGRAYARAKGRDVVLAPDGTRLTAEGPTSTLEEMIASTTRGIWVNRLTSVNIMNQRTLLLTGTTRDGTFLIENGKVTKPIKNFRFTESPFFILNKLEAFGEPVRASRDVVAPRLKVRDFDFTSLTDAI